MPLRSVDPIRDRNGRSWSAWPTVVGKLSRALSWSALAVAGCIVALSIRPAEAPRTDIAHGPDVAPMALPQAGGRDVDSAAGAAPQATIAPRAEPQGRAAAPAVAFPYRPEPQ